MTAVSDPVPHRVVLVREWDAQMSGSGCCGRLGGITCDINGDDDYAHTRTRMEAMGHIYRALRAELPAEQVEVSVVDPRNMVWLIPTIVRDGWQRGFRPRQLWRELVRGIRDGAIIVDGRTLPGDDIPEPDAAVDAVLRELADATSAGDDESTARP